MKSPSKRDEFCPNALKRVSLGRVEHLVSSVGGLSNAPLGRAALTLVCALLLTVSHALDALWPLAGVALVPWLAATRRASPLGALGLGVLLGTAFGCSVVPWIPEALRALGSSWATSLGGLLVTAAWAKAPLFAALGGVARALRDAPASVQVVGTAAALGGGEWIVSTSSAGVPAAFVGHTQLPATGVAQLAAAGGVPLVSAWVAALNTALALAVVRRPGARPLASGLAAGWLGMAAFGLPLAEGLRPAAPEGSETTLLVVQPALPRYARWDAAAQPWILETLGEHTARALARHGPEVDAILWPENLLTVPIETSPTLADSLRHLVDGWDRPLITGLVRPPEGRVSGRYRSSVVWVEPGRGMVSAVDKTRAVPLVEDSRPVPGAGLLAPLFGRAARWPKVEEAESAGRALAGRFQVVTALCYEVLFPGIVAARRDSASLAILNPADDSWVAGPGATHQLTDWAAFRAIEQRLPLIRVAHGGLSTVIDAFGRRGMSLPLDVFASMTVEVRPSAPPSPSERLGLFALPLALAFVVGWGHARWRRHQRGKRT